MRSLVLLVLIYVAYRVIKSVMIKKMNIGNSGSFNESRSGEDDVMIQDPQCGVYFPKREGISLRHGNETLYFCSEKCRDEFTKGH